MSEEALPDSGPLIFSLFPAPRKMEIKALRTEREQEMGGINKKKGKQDERAAETNTEDGQE